MPPIDPLRQFDDNAVNDDFTPPFRRSYYDDYNYRLAPGLYPTYTRGPPGRFRKIGTLIADTYTTSASEENVDVAVPANDKFKFLILMGRQKYNYGDYEYYAISPNAEHRLKFYIDTRGREITDGQNPVVIDQLAGYTFTFKEDPDLSPRYDPYMV
jgi:hypothetical protein